MGGAVSRLATLAIAALLGCGGASGGEPTVPLRPIGWGPADVWHTLPITVVSQAANAGLQFIVTEHFPTVQAADWRRGQLLQSFPTEARAWNQAICAAGQTHIVFLLNWNVLPFRERSDAWFAEVLNQALSIYDPACTWLEAVVEPDEGDLGKARRWTQLAADSWGGPFILASAAQGWGIRADYIDIHPATAVDAAWHLQQGGPSTLVITDGGQFTNPLSILPSLPGLADLSLTSGVPFIVYTDRYTGPHEPILEALSQ